MEALSMRSEKLRKGDVVEVRGAADILATLDENGDLDGLPFMPEMVPMCGQRFTVAARAERVCDTITGGPIARLMTNTVLLDGQRCDGSGHGGCAASCLVYWNEAWLRKVDGHAVPASVPAVTVDDPSAVEALRELTSRSATHGDGDSLRFRCQATQAIAASAPASGKNPIPYLRECTNGNVSFGRFVKVMARAAVMEAGNRIGKVPDPPVRGTSAKSVRTPTLDLQPGEWVRVKGREEIEATLNDKGKNRGLWFDREMLRFCGQVFQVRNRVDRLVDERTGEMIELSSDCVALEGATCSAQNSLGRWLCPRAIYPYWREGWLERVDSTVSVDLPAGHAASQPTPV
jgi:hypothetical protein